MINERADAEARRRCSVVFVSALGGLDQDPHPFVPETLVEQGF